MNLIPKINLILSFILFKYSSMQFSLFSSFIKEELLILLLSLKIDSMSLTFISNKSSSCSSSKNSIILSNAALWSIYSLFFALFSMDSHKNFCSSFVDQISLSPIYVKKESNSVLIN